MEEGGGVSGGGRGVSAELGHCINEGEEHG